MENLNDIEIIRSKISDFKEIVQSFSEVLTAENEALEKYDMETIGALYEQKVKTVGAYRNMVAFFIKNQENLKKLSEEERSDLKKVSTDLDVLLKQNETLLKTKMETGKLVMDTIVNVAKMNNNCNSTSYGSQGKYSPMDNNSNALAINRTL